MRSRLAPKRPVQFQGSRSDFTIHRREPALEDRRSEFKCSTKKSQLQIRSRFAEGFSSMDCGYAARIPLRSDIPLRKTVSRMNRTLGNLPA